MEDIMSKDNKTGKCKVEGCKNSVGKNKKTGVFFEMCDFHFKDKKNKKDSVKKPEVKPTATKKIPEQKKEEDVYDPNGKLVLNVSGAYFINHPKKIRYIRIESYPIIERNADFSITIKSKGRRVLSLPFKSLEEQQKAYDELREVIK
jgi:hypothetical protein